MTTSIKRRLGVILAKKASQRRVVHRASVSQKKIPDGSSNLYPRPSPALQKRKLLLNWLKEN